MEFVKLSLEQRKDFTPAQELDYRFRRQQAAAARHAAKQGKVAEMQAYRKAYYSTYNKSKAATNGN